MALRGRTVGFLVADETDEGEYEAIARELRKQGVECVVIAPDQESLKRIAVAGLGTGITLEGTCGFWLDGLVIPGGNGVDAFLHLDAAIDLVQAIDAEDKPIAALGRGALMLVAADVVEGRHLAVPQDLERVIVPMGGITVLSPYFKEGNWITADGADQAGVVAESLVCALDSELLPTRPQG